MKDFIYILGIDPGNHYGVAYCKVDISNNIQVNFTNCYDLNKYQHNLSNQSFQPISKYQVLQQILQELLNRFNISLCCIEQAYVNIKYPAAAQSVVENVAYSISVMQQFSIRPILIHNKSIKRHLCNNTHHITKDDIKQSILSHPKICLKLIYNDFSNQNENNLTEHEYDAISTVWALSQMAKIF